MKNSYQPGDSATKGVNLVCKGWIQEAAMRLLMNNLDQDVAENPAELIVYGGSGKAARNLECLYQIIENLRELENDETLLVQSGKPVGIFKSHEDAPRIIISNSMLVPKWANWQHFHELDKKGLMMFGQMTAGSWIYIGSQGILQGTYETFVEAARQHFNGETSGKLILSAGLGGMGGAQPLAATMAGFIFLGIEMDHSRIQKRIDSGYCDKIATNLDNALELIAEAKTNREAISIGLVGNAAELFPELVKRGIVPDLVTDQTSAHDPLNGYIPKNMTLEEAAILRRDNPDGYIILSYQSMRDHVQAMLDFKIRGAYVFDYGNNIRAGAVEGGLKEAFGFPGFVPAYIRPLFCEGKGPFRWVALSGNPEDIYTIDEELVKLFPEDQALKRWLILAREKVQFQGLPARICWLGYGDRRKAGLLFNKLVAEKKVQAPIVIGRDHLDCGSVASPNRETEAMIDGSDAVADWPILNFGINAVGGASWVSFHHGGGVGMGYSLHSGMVIVADGTIEAESRLSRVLTTDPGMGILRHADAGYDLAIACAKKHAIKIPFLK